MDGINDWIYPTTRIGDAVKFRPASLELFYRLGCDPWKESGKTLRELSGERGLPMDELGRELADLAAPRADSPWEDIPVHFLIDFLTTEHRQLLYSDLPAFRRLLEMPFSDASGGHLFRVLLKSFHRIHGKLEEHMQEEEDRIFPAILRNEFILRTEAPSDSGRRAAAPLLVSSQLIGREEELAVELDRWTRSLGTEGILGGRPKAAEFAAEAMRRLDRKIRTHGDLERNRLFPIAARMENELAGVHAG